MKPDLPERGSARYEQLVACVATFGWTLGAALTKPPVPSSQATYYAWRRKAHRGVEPYATWFPGFLADYLRTRERRRRFRETKGDIT